MEIKTFNIASSQDIKNFFVYLINDLDLNFHPDNSFCDYINFKTDEPTFTTSEAKQLNGLINQCFDVCKAQDLDIYEIALNAQKFALKKNLLVFHAERFQTAYSELCAFLTDNSSEFSDDTICRNYPFEFSLDDYEYKLNKWVQDIKEAN